MRSLKQHGKLHNVIKEMRRLDIGVLGISDTKWPGKDRYTTTEGEVLYYSGKDNASTEPYGVAVLLSKETAKSVRSFIPHSNRDRKSVV